MDKCNAQSDAASDESTTQNECVYFFLVHIFCFNSWTGWVWMRGFIFKHPTQKTETDNNNNNINGGEVMMKIENASKFPKQIGFENNERTKINVDFNQVNESVWSWKEEEKNGSVMSNAESRPNYECDLVTFPIRFTNMHSMYVRENETNQSTRHIICRFHMKHTATWYRCN